MNTEPPFFLYSAHTYTVYNQTTQLYDIHDYTLLTYEITAGNTKVIIKRQYVQVYTYHSLQQNSCKQRNALKYMFLQEDVPAC